MPMQQVRRPYYIRATAPITGKYQSKRPFKRNLKKDKKPSTAETRPELKCSSSLITAIVPRLAFARMCILYPIKAEMKQGTVD